MSVSEAFTFAVDPARLAHGAWSHGAAKTIGEGDIPASYSADRIAEGRSIRAAFRWQAAEWVCVSMQCRAGEERAHAYRLVHPQAFEGAPTTYREKTKDCEAARGDPMGFYHGMAVTRGGETMILCGPEARFIRGEAEQPDLFAGL
jgi:hypothetical protein